MNIIRTAEDMARAVSQPLDTELATLLQTHSDRLAEYEGYDLSELAMFAIVQPTDDLNTINAAIGWSLLANDTFSKPVELIARHNGWFEVTFILSDDGFGLVLLVERHAEADPALITACRRAAAESGNSAIQ